MGAVKDQKAKTTLTELCLYGNKVGDAGATALAEALKATVLTCSQWALCLLFPNISLQTEV